MIVNKNTPQTIEEAVEYLLANLSLNDEIQIVGMKEEDLPNLHFSMGSYIRNEFGLWSDNEKLMESCQALSGRLDVSADDVSMVIIKALWARLKAEDRLNII